MTQMPGHIRAHIIAKTIGVQASRPQQPLHRLRTLKTGMLGQPPAVLPLDRRQQPPHERPRRTPRLHPREPVRHPAHQLIELRPPPARIYATTSGHYAIFSSPHNP
jgi:hypothetical protein